VSRRSVPWANIEREPFVACFPVSVLRLVSPTACVVLLVIQSHQRPGHSTFPGRRRIAQLCNISEATVKRAVTELVNAGLVRVEQRRTDGGRVTTNVYVLHPRLRPGAPRVTGDPRSLAEDDTDAAPWVTDDSRPWVTDDPTEEGEGVSRDTGRSSNDNRATAAAVADTAHAGIDSGPLADAIEAARQALAEQQGAET
jgi:DNA-binding transcriptional MocR family regulator